MRCGQRGAVLPFRGRQKTGWGVRCRRRRLRGRRLQGCPSCGAGARWGLPSPMRAGRSRTPRLCQGRGWRSAWRGGQLCRAGAVDRRDVHLAVQAPDGAFPAPCAQGGLELRGSVRGGDGDNRGAVGGFGRLAQVASRPQGVMEPIATIEQENIDVAVELAVLKSVVEDVHRWQVKLEDVWRRRSLGKLAGTEALTGNEDGDAG